MPEETDLTGAAIIGMSGRFPGAAGPDELWRNLMAGTETISRFPPEELEAPAPPGCDAAGSRFVPARGVLDAPEDFDAAFFGMSPREAEAIDPQHRVLLECCWEALEGAGYDPDVYGGSIGVYAGCSLSTYLLYHLGRDGGRDLALKYQTDEFPAVFGNDKDFLATRISHRLNLKGPSLSVQTACSTSLVAVCQACLAVMTYQCDLALAGGASITFPQKRGYRWYEGGLASPDGRCRAFDAAASGTVFGHGAGAVLVKRLAEAVADRDPILAVVRGAAVNNDGAVKVSYAAPSIDGQAAAIAAAQAMAGVDPATISYVEAHGTGTALGDPIEVAALTRAFRGGRADANGFCALGSVKTHIGHLDVAAGIAGLIKTVLQFRHGLIPPLLHFSAANPGIDFAGTPFFPVTRPLPWPAGERPRRAGVSSFGVGGTNAHVVLEEAPALPPSGEDDRSPQLLPLSARTPAALRRIAQALAAHLEAHPGLKLADVAFTLQVGRKRFDQRRAFVARDTAEAIGRLREWSAGSAPAAADGPGEDLGPLRALAEAWHSGGDPDWHSLHRVGRRRVTLPTYPFERQRCAPPEGARRADAASEAPAPAAVPPPPGDLEALIRAQLGLMNRQLDMLRGAPAGGPSDSTT